jgi:beta-glucanase (GH16 family)
MAPVITRPSSGGVIFVWGATIMRRRLVRGRTAVGLVFTVVVVATACLPVTPPPPNAIFVDQFNGTALDPAWIAIDRPGDSANFEVECYKPANDVEGGGYLTITSKVDSTCPNYRYTSGMVQWKSLNFTYGTITFRAKFSGGIGTWPSIWLLGSDCQQTNPVTPDNGGTCQWFLKGSEEVDMAEVYSGGPTMVNQGIISPDAYTHCSATTTDVTQNFHVYTVIWAPNSLTWQIDGVQTCHFTVGVPSTPMFVIMNTALAGSGGGPNVSGLPQQSQIDYLMVSQ